MVDGIIKLGAEVVRLKPRRSLEVSKMRGAEQLRGVHSFEITHDGIHVRPRVEALLQPLGHCERPTRHDRRTFGIGALDTMLGGGITSSSNTMLLGPSGVGKTTLGLHFLNSGLALGERALLFTFYERPEEILAKASRMGMVSLARGIESGQIKVIWQSSVEANIDTIGSNLLDGFHSVRPSRIMLDGMHGFQATLDPADRIQDFFAAIADYFMAESATFLFSAETGDVVGEPVKPPFVNASRMCQNILLLRYTELRGRLARVIAVLKMRDSDFDPSLHELRIENSGVVVGSPVDGAEMLLTGQPRHLSE
jgi:circadian clock protein KaiC